MNMRHTSHAILVTAMKSSPTRNGKHRLRRFLASALSASILATSLSALPAQATEHCPPSISFAENTVPSPYEGSYALLIGVSNYEHWRPLIDVPAHINELRRILGCKGFEVTTVLDPNGEQLREQIRKFIRNYGASRGSKNNRLLVYFSGHGHAIYRPEAHMTQGFIVPRDAPDPGSGPQNNAIGFLYSAMNFDELVTQAKRIRAKHSMFLIDASLSGSIFSSETNWLSQSSLGTLSKARINERVIHFFTAGDAFQGIRDDGLFKSTFIEAITTAESDLDKDEILTGSELGNYLHHKIHNQTRGLQSPRNAKLKINVESSGEFQFSVPRS